MITHFERTTSVVKLNLRLILAYILAKRTITIQGTSAADTNANNTNKKVTFKSCVPFTDCIYKKKKQFTSK